MGKFSWAGSTQMPYISNGNASHTAAALGGHNERWPVSLCSWQPQKEDTVPWGRHEEWVHFPAIEVLILTVPS